MLLGRGVAAAAAGNATVSTTLTPTAGRITVEATGTPPPVPVFFTASVDQSVSLRRDTLSSDVTVAIHVLQGHPETITLGLRGTADVVSVAGTNVRQWAVRQGTGAASAFRFLDLELAAVPERAAEPDITAAIHLERDRLDVPGDVEVPIVSGGEASALTWHARIVPSAEVDVAVARAEGVSAVERRGEAGRAFEFVNRGDPAVALHLTERGAVNRDAEFTQLQIAGRVDESAMTVVFRATGTARVERAGARLPLLAGNAALSGQSVGEGWHAELVRDDDNPHYDIVFDRKGVVSVAVEFAAAIRRTEKSDWRELDFQIFGGSVVPISLAGLTGPIDFDRQRAVVLSANAGAWQGFLPASGHADIAWKGTREKTDAALFFATTEEADVRVAAGLLRQVSQIRFHVMQGKLSEVRLRVDGPGEIVGIDGANVVGWRLSANGAQRVIQIQLSRPIEGDGLIAVRAQSVLGAFPVRGEATAFIPEGGVRHAGYVRVANAGAVRLEVVDAQGLLQLAPAQYPGEPIESGADQVFVYRFPSAERHFAILASPIVPEVGVSQITTYTLGETDRVMESDLELDVREAPLRDWSVDIPADYAVVALQGAGVSDFRVESTTSADYRTLKVLFAEPVFGRQVLHLQLEKNQAAVAGDWRLPPLRFSGAKSVRGHVGVVATAGYRVVPASTQQLAEVPLNLFPKQIAGLQQAFRLREPDWSAALHVEALGQSIQADVFHLYSLRPGAVSASILINYFVVGAPASECRIEVPEDAGNIDVTGQGVRRDWRREGNVLIVSLHQPVLGALTLLVTFEQPLSTRGATLRPGEVHPVNVQTERGFVDVVSAFQVQAGVTKADGNLLKLEPRELPPELRLLATAPAIATYQYTARPFALELGVSWYRPGETVDQVIDFAKFSSQVARDGQIVTDAQLFVKTRGRKMLRLQLPAGVKLWETRVDGDLVTARADGNWTLVPLTARLNPNEPVRVVLRFGQLGAGTNTVELSAPKMTMPVVVGEWTIRSERDRLLEPRGGTAELTAPNLTERGFEWLASLEQPSVISLLLLVALAILLSRYRTGPAAFGTAASAALAITVALFLSVEASVFRRANRLEAVYSATVVPVDGSMTIRFANVPAWQAMISVWGVGAALAGLGCAMVAWRRRARPGASSRVLAFVAVSLLLGGLLAQRGGAVLFFVTVAILAALFVLLPALRLGWAIWRGSHLAGGAAGAAPAAVSLLMGGVLLTGVLAHPVVAYAEPAAAVHVASAAQSIVQRWDIHDQRLYAEIDISGSGEPGDSIALLHAPAVLTGFVGNALHVTKVRRTDTDIVYFLVPERAGPFVGHAKFELPVTDLKRGVPFLTGPAATQRLSIQLDQAGWEFSSPSAVMVAPQPTPPPGHSGAELVLGASGDPTLYFVPRQRDAAAEATRFFAEAAHLFLPGPGVVNGSVRVTIRPVQGRVSSLDVHVPEGWSVADVMRGPVGAWRFDPAQRTLHLAVEPAQSEAFKFTVELQRAAAALPYDLALQTVRIAGATGEIGSLAIAFGSDAQPEQLRPTGLAAMSVDDFDRETLPRGPDGQPTAMVQSAYRYSDANAALSLRVTAVEPEVRVASRQLLSLGDDRLVLAADLAVSIFRVGLFQVSFVLPPGLDLEAASGSALSHWTEAAEGDRRIVTLHLNGRTLGPQNFALTLSGPAPNAAKPWEIPQLRLREASRQTGDVQLVPERGIRLRALERKNVSELDPRSLGAVRPGTLAFRLLDEDASLTVGIETLEPWVTVQALEELTLREGQALTRLALKYRVENAAVKELRVSLPGLTEDQAKTIHATGPAVNDVVPVPGAADTWRIRLQRGVIGETTVQLEFQGPTAQSDSRQSIAMPAFAGVRQVEQYVSVRVGGRLEIEPAELPRGWQRVDWSAVPVNLQDRSDRSVPSLALRALEPEKPLEVMVRRHEVADALKLRVTRAELATIFSPRATTLTAVDLRIAVAEKSALHVRLPEGALLFNTLLNGESVPVVRDADGYLFHVSPNTATDATAQVRLVYSITGRTAGGIKLVGPRLSVPLEDVSWRVVLPPGYKLAHYHGGLRLEEERRGGSFDVADYEAAIASRRAADAKQATEYLQAASTLLQQGQQTQAGEVLARAAKASSLDEASNEDARVQLRALRTQQTVVGLNTRRQRLYLDNSAEAQRNEQLEQAANLNPVIQGKLDFDPQQLDQLLMGNTVEENTALKGIAGRIVDQQLAAEPTTSAIDVTFAEHGRVLTFTRSLQVDGEAPLELRVAIERESANRPVFAVAILGVLGACVAFGWRKPRASVPAV